MNVVFVKPREGLRLSEAISSASGKFAHRLDLPAADVVLGPTSLATLGSITWALS
jgi:uncharacterized phage protein gp47/JayE